MDPLGAFSASPFPVASRQVTSPEHFKKVCPQKAGQVSWQLGCCGISKGLHTSPYSESVTPHVTASSGLPQPLQFFPREISRMSGQGKLLSEKTKQDWQQWAENATFV